MRLWPVDELSCGALVIHIKACFRKIPEDKDRKSGLLASTTSLIYRQVHAVWDSSGVTMSWITLSHSFTDNSTCTIAQTFTAYLHVEEDTWLLKMELNIHAALPEGFPAPAQVVVPGPHPQLFSLYEVVSSQDAVTQLTQASKLRPAHNTTLYGLTYAGIVLDAVDHLSLSIYKCLHVLACNDS